MRFPLATVLEVAGLGAVSVGAFIWSTAAGFVVAGLSAVVVGYFLED